MNENFVLRILQIVGKRLIPPFEEIDSRYSIDGEDIVKAAEEEIKLVLEQHEIQNLILENYNNFWPEKNEVVAKRNREDGNEAFQIGNMELAILLYTEAMRFSPVHPTLYHGEDMAAAAANRSAAFYQLQNFEASLKDIEVALEAGYSSVSAYKLYIRKCKCCLELGRIFEAQSAFDQAIEAIERSGLKKDLRKGIATDLQEAFINLTKNEPEDAFIKSNSVEKISENDLWPSWAELQNPHPSYPAALDKISIVYEDTKGRHVIANRDIEVGEVIFREKPLVYYMHPDDKEVNACLQCFSYIKDDALIPCPTCSEVQFCSLTCRTVALNGYHKVECKMKHFLDGANFFRLPLIMLAVRAITQKPLSFFRSQREDFKIHDVKNGISADFVYRSQDYKNGFNLLTHRFKRETMDRVTKTVFSSIIVKMLESVEYFSESPNLEDDRILIGRLLTHFMQVVQFNTHMIESVYSNRLIASDAETRIWKAAKFVNHGEFVETTRLGGGIYPTIANVNHSCDPNFLLVNVQNKAVAIASRHIAAGEEIHDTYGAVFYHMTRDERQEFLKKSHWFDCQCTACIKNWPIFMKLPRDYLRLPGSHFKYNRCNRKELQKDVDKVKKEIDSAKEIQNFEHSRQMFHGWMKLLDELLHPPHQDFINVRRGIKNCLWLQSPNIIPVREDEALLRTKAKFKEKKCSK